MQRILKFVAACLRRLALIDWFPSRRSLRICAFLPKQLFDQPPLLSGQGARLHRADRHSEDASHNT
jgi:hypothetical protein